MNTMKRSNCTILGDEYCDNVQNRVKYVLKKEEKVQIFKNCFLRQR